VAAVKDVGKSTPIVEILRRLLEGASQPVRLEELAVNALQAWGRDLPNNPYDDVALVYKLATRVLLCDVHYDEVGGKVPLVHREDLLEGPKPLRALLGPADLNHMSDTLKHIKVSLRK
jgi:hypothetical protein